ncbi:MAG TPA: helix-turn-helix transcriptional regulator [Caulobacteraceae bacterium]|nr:helix-turn-helix transcriptional regulator [Caulobacteraceae bacterium]
MRWEDIVAANLKQLRKERRLTQEKLAFESGVAVRHIRAIEGAKTSATVGALGKLSEALEVHPSAFLVDPASYS